MLKTAIIAGVALIAAEATASELDKLVSAYPDFLEKHDDAFVYWKDGTRMPVSDGKSDKSFEERLRSASILDQLSQPYRKGPPAGPPARDDDPGRIRNTAFFDKMYGNCDKHETQATLVSVPWVPKLGGRPVRISSVNGVDAHLRAVSDELEMHPELKPFLVPTAGTFNCRVVKDTGQRSMHAWGVAIDINVAHSDYWMWRKDGRYVNRIPFAIVEIFEKHGFIWGGKWSHFDTMHFEYRPELL